METLIRQTHVKLSLSSCKARWKLAEKCAATSHDQSKVQWKLDGPNKSPTKTRFTLHQTKVQLTQTKSNQNSIHQTKVQWTKTKKAQPKLDSPNKSPMDQNKVQPKLDGPKKSPIKTQWTKEKSNQSSMDRRKVQSKLNGPKKRLKTAENCSLKKIRWQMFFRRVVHFCRTFPGLCFLRASSE